MDRPRTLVARFVAPGVRPEELDIAAQRFASLARFMDAWGQDIACRVYPVEGRMGYFNALRDAAEVPSAHLVTVEHDMLPEDFHVAHLMACPRDFCACAYHLHPVTTNCRGDVWAHRRADGSWIDWGEEQAALVGLGLTKLPVAPLRAALRHGPWEWGVLDDRLSKALATTWHVHWPAVEHLHR